MKNNNNYNYLTFIPARSGSIGIKNKNIQKIGKKNLIEITINFIKKSKLKKNFIYLSTDSKKYQKLAKKLNVNCNYLRSKKISKSNSKIEDAVIEFVTQIKKIKKNIKFKYIIILLPTQPFRSLKTFKSSIKLIGKSYKSIISVKNLNRSKEYIFTTRKNKLKIPSYVKSTNRQYIESNYTPCGCFYIVEAKSFMKKKSFYIPKIKHIITKFPQNLDIDTKFDLSLANMIFKSGKN